MGVVGGVGMVVGYVVFCDLIFNDDGRGTEY